MKISKYNSHNFKISSTFLGSLILLLYIYIPFEYYTNSVFNYNLALLQKVLRRKVHNSALHYYQHATLLSRHFDYKPITQNMEFLLNAIAAKFTLGKVQDI